MFKEYEELCKEAKTKISFNSIVSDNSILCQFLLDPASFNLANRIHLSDPILGSLFKLSRDYCHAVNAARKENFDKPCKRMKTILPTDDRSYSHSAQHYIDLYDRDVF